MTSTVFYIFWFIPALLAERFVRQPVMQYAAMLWLILENCTGLFCRFLRGGAERSKEKIEMNDFLQDTEGSVRPVVFHVVFFWPNSNLIRESNIKSIHSFHFLSCLYFRTIGFLSNLWSTVRDQVSVRIYFSQVVGFLW